MSVEPQLQQSIENNIDWCARVVAAHGSIGQRSHCLWSHTDICLPYYPNIITTDRNSQTETLREIDRLRLLGLTGAWGIKDSFADLDLENHGFQAVLQGQWYAATAIEPVPDPTIGWSVVKIAQQLDVWQQVWSNGEVQSPPIFTPDLLADEDVQFWSGFSDGKLQQGAIINPSAEVLGVSNWFSITDPDFFPTSLLAAVEGREDRTFVCWSADASIERAGFRPLGPMRVWINAQT